MDKILLKFVVSDKSFIISRLYTRTRMEISTINLQGVKTVRSKDKDLPASRHNFLDVLGAAGLGDNVHISREGTIVATAEVDAASVSHGESLIIFSFGNGDDVIEVVAKTAIVKIFPF